MTSLYTQHFTVYSRDSRSAYTASPFLVPPGVTLPIDLETVGPVVMVGVRHGYRYTVTDLYEAGEAMVRDGNRLVRLAEGIEHGTTDGPADWLELGMDSFRTAA